MSQGLHRASMVTTFVLLMVAVTQFSCSNGKRPAPASHPSASQPALATAPAVVTPAVVTPPVVTPHTTQPAQGRAVKTDDACQVVKGKWVRPDGGYVISITDISSDGTMTCAYFNPNPVRVSQATATRDGDVTKVFVELRDEGYPGCTYKMVYDAQSDQLKGIYFQAAVQESYSIYFVRMK
jgi:hypothetical protein